MLKMKTLFHGKNLQGFSWLLEYSKNHSDDTTSVICYTETYKGVYPDGAVGNFRANLIKGFILSFNIK